MKNLLFKPLILSMVLLSALSLSSRSEASPEPPLSDQIQLTGWRFQVLAGKSPFFKDAAGRLKGVFTKTDEREFMPSLLAIEQSFEGPMDQIPQWINKSFLNKEGVILNRVNLSQDDRSRWLFVYQIPDKQTNGYRVVSVIAIPIPGKLILLSMESTLKTYKNDVTELLGALR